MKTKIISSIVLLLLIVVYGNSFGQSATSEPKLGFIIKADLINPAIAIKSNHEKQIDFHRRSSFSLTIEKPLTKRQSVQLTGAYFSEITGGQNYYHRDERYQFQLIPEYKFFVVKSKPVSGPYIGGYLLYERQHQFYNHVGSNYYLSNTSLGGGLNTGYQFYIKNRIVIDLLRLFSYEST